MAFNSMFLFEGMFPPGQKELNEDFKGSVVSLESTLKNSVSFGKELKETLSDVKKLSADLSSNMGSSGGSGGNEDSYNRGMRQVEIFDLVVSGIARAIGAMGMLAARAAEFETSLTQTSYRMLDPIGRMNSLYTQNNLLNARQQLTSEGNTPWMSTSASEMVGYLDIFQQYGKLRNDTKGAGSQANLMELARIGGQGARERGFTRMEAAQTSMQYNVAGVDLNDLRGFNTELGKMARLGAMSKAQVRGIDQAILKLAYSFNMSGKEIESFGREYMKVAGVISLSGGDPNKILGKMNAYADGSKEGMLNALILGYDTKNPTQMLNATQGGAQQLLGMLEGVPDAMKAHVAQLMAPAMGLGGFDLKEIQQLGRTGSVKAKATEKELLTKIEQHTGETYVAHAEMAQKTLNDIEASAIRIGEGQLNMMVKQIQRFDVFIDKMLGFTEILKDNPGKTALALAGVLSLPAAFRAFGPQLITGLGAKFTTGLTKLSSSLGKTLMSLGSRLAKTTGFVGKLLGGKFATGIKRLGATLFSGFSGVGGLLGKIWAGITGLPAAIGAALGLGIVKIAKFFTSDKLEGENIELSKERVASFRAQILDIDAKLADPKGLSSQKIKSLQNFREILVKNMAGEQATVAAGITGFKEMFTGLKTDKEKLADTLGTSDEDFRMSDNVFSARDREYSGRNFLPADVVAFRRSVMNNIESEGFKITETDEWGGHSTRSAHYQGRALDFRAKDRLGSVKGQQELVDIIKNLRAQGFTANLELTGHRAGISEELRKLSSINTGASAEHVHVSWGRDKVGSLQGAEDQGVSSALEKAWDAGGIKGAPMVEEKNGRIVVRQRPPSAAVGAAEEATTDMVSTMGTPGETAVQGAGEEQAQLVFDSKVHEVLTTILQEIQGRRGGHVGGPTIRAGTQASNDKIARGFSDIPQMRPSVFDRPQPA